MNSRDIKDLCRSLGADLCGIAGMDRFASAPEGYHPRDVLPECRSVIAFACRFPAAALRSPSHVPYTRIRNSISAKLDQIALDLCLELDRRYGVGAVPVPAIESQWDARTQRWRSVVSLKHAAQAAGLGTIGRHSLLITKELGSMVWLGAVLCEAELEADPLPADLCEGCGRCIEACPVNALQDPDMQQQTCFDHAFGNDPEKQIWVISCHRCRDACPHHLGTENRP